MLGKEVFILTSNSNLQEITSDVYFPKNTGEWTKRTTILQLNVNNDIHYKDKTTCCS